MAAGDQSTAFERALLFIDRVEEDAALAPPIRRAARSLRHLAIDSPALAMERLEAAALRYLPGVDRTPPETDLVRAVELRTFFEYHLDGTVKAAFRTAEDYRSFIEEEVDPDATLLSHLSNDPITIRWHHSWLTRETDIAGMNGIQTVRVLEMRQRPPLVVFQLSLADMLASGVTIRTPCSLDTVLGRHVLWRPSGLGGQAREYVDGDIPRSAVTSLEFRR